MEIDYINCPNCNCNKWYIFFRNAGIVAQCSNCLEEQNILVAGG